MMYNIGIIAGFLGVGCIMLAFAALIPASIQLIVLLVLNKQTKPLQTALFALALFGAGAVFIIIGSLTGSIIS